MKKSSLSSLLPLLLLAILAACVLSVLVTGADVYKNIVENGTSAYSHRTAAQFISTKVRQAPSADSITAVDFGGTDALCISETADGLSLVTLIYCHGGYLRELYSLADGEFSPDDGEKLFKTDKFSASVSGEMLEITLTSGGKDSTLFFSIAAESEDAQ